MRALKAVYNDELSPLEELLRKGKSKTIYQRNIKILAAKLFKIKSKERHWLYNSATKLLEYYSSNIKMENANEF